MTNDAWLRTAESVRSGGRSEASVPVAPDEEPTAADLDLLRHHDRVFERLLDLAESRVRERRDESALEWCRAAAGYAVNNATGRLRSIRLEQLVDEVAARVLPAIESPPEAGSRRRVLHVLSDTADIGGA